MSLHRDVLPHQAGYQCAASQESQAHNRTPSSNQRCACFSRPRCVPLVHCTATDLGRLQHNTDLASISCLIPAWYSSHDGTDETKHHQTYSKYGLLVDGKCVFTCFSRFKEIHICVGFLVLFPYRGLYSFSPTSTNVAISTKDNPSRTLNTFYCRVSLALETSSATARHLRCLLQKVRRPPKIFPVLPESRLYVGVYVEHTGSSEALVIRPLLDTWARRSRLPSRCYLSSSRQPRTCYASA